jgi:hypothetical protein
MTIIIKITLDQPSRHTPHDYETTTEFLINYITKTFDYGSDIGRALKELKEVDTDPWKPRYHRSMEAYFESE